MLEIELNNFYLEKLVVATIIDLLKKDSVTIKYLSYFPQLWRYMYSTVEPNESTGKKTYGCNDQDKRIATEICSFYESEELCDITLIAGINRFRLPAHRLILSASSGYFRAMFRSNLSDANTPELTFEQWDGQTLKTLVDFMYTPIIDVTNENIENVLRAADFFQVDSVVTYCCSFMSDGLNTNNCLGVVFFAEQHNYTELLDEALKYTYENFEQVIKEQEFLNMNAKQLARFLASDDIRVDSEKSVLQSLVQWIRHDTENRKNSVLELLKLIRYPLLEARQIAENREYLCCTPECQIVVLNWLQYLLSPQAHSLSQNLTKCRKSCKKLYLINGNDNLTNKFLVRMFNYTKKEWSSVNWPTPSERIHNFTASMIDKFLILGRSSRIECLDFRTMTWSQIPPMLYYNNYCLAFVELDSCLYAFGDNSLGKYDFRIKTWTELPKPIMRLATRACVVEGVLYCCDEYGRSIEFYDTQTNKWKTLPLRNDKNCLLSTLGSVGGNLYMIGGEYRHNGHTIKKSNTVERFNTKTGKWSKVRSLKVARSNILVTTFNNKLIACGGHDGFKFTKIFEEYDPVTDKWTQLPPLDVNVDSHSYIFAAYIDPNPELK